MLPRAYRLTDASDFRTASRGRRAGSRSVVVHVATDAATDADSVALTGPRIGFVVGKGVGGSVVRNRVRRRLRHLMRDRLHLMPPGALISVRALPASADVDASELAVDLDRCLSKAGIPVGCDRFDPPRHETVSA